MDFRTFFTGLPVSDRESFAQQAGTSRGYCNQVAYTNKQIELGMADVFVALGCGQLSLDDLPLTERAVAQRAIRERVADRFTGDLASPMAEEGA